jgi:hypothetical protein
MQKKYSSDNKTVHLTKGDLNTPISMSLWIEKNFSGEIKVDDIDPKNLENALDGILHDQNFTMLSDEKKGEFIKIFNDLKEKLKFVKKLNE